MFHSFLKLPLLIQQQPLLVSTHSKLQPTHEPRSRHLPSYKIKEPSINSPSPSSPSSPSSPTLPFTPPTPTTSHLGTFNRTRIFLQLRTENHVQTFQSRDGTGKRVATEKALHFLKQTYSPIFRLI